MPLLLSSFYSLMASEKWLRNWIAF